MWKIGAKCFIESIPTFFHDFHLISTTLAKQQQKKHSNRLLNLQYLSTINPGHWKFNEQREMD